MASFGADTGTQVHAVSWRSYTVRSGAGDGGRTCGGAGAGSNSHTGAAHSSGDATGADA